jgi:hypothetical protein
MNEIETFQIKTKSVPLILLLAQTLKWYNMALLLTLSFLKILKFCLIIHFNCGFWKHIPLKQYLVIEYFGTVFGSVPPYAVPAAGV